MELVNPMANIEVHVWRSLRMLKGGVWSANSPEDGIQVSDQVTILMSINIEINNYYSHEFTLIIFNKMHIKLFSHRYYVLSKIVFSGAGMFLSITVDILKLRLV